MSIFYELRREYNLTHLTESDLTDSPYELFDLWLSQIMEIKAITDPTAMVIATVDEHQMPYQRSVLMKSLDENGVVFYTNKKSRKGQHLSQNPKVSALFPWLAAERQVIFNGQVEPLSESENDTYFYSRPYESQVAACVSAQSHVIENRHILEQRYHKMITEQADIKRPLHWGGFRIKVNSVEFWQGGEHRLHDRFLYQKTKVGWQTSRLQP